MAMTAWSAKVSSKLDLLIGKRAHLRATDQDDADGDTVTQQWDGQGRCEFPIRSCYAGLRIVRVGSSQDIGDMDSLPVEHGPARHGTTHRSIVSRRHAQSGYDPISSPLPR